jgi:hypothetical protein
MAWLNRANNIGQRDWSEIIIAWSEINRSFDTATFLNDALEDHVESLLQADQVNDNSLVVLQFEDKTLLLSELVFTQVKANHAFQCALERISSGGASWGVTDAYHASMMLMRSILAALGIFVCRVYDRNVIIDVFPWMGRIDAQKKFKKANRNWHNTVSVISCKTKYIDQSDLFTIFQRVMNIATVPPEIWPELVVQNVIAASKTHFSSARNKLIYGSRFWFRSDDLLGECLSTEWSTAPLRSYATHSFVKDENASELDSYCDTWVLYKLSKAAHQKVYNLFTDSIGVFSYVESRSEASGLSTLNRRFL